MRHQKTQQLHRFVAMSLGLLLAAVWYWLWWMQLDVESSGGWLVTSGEVMLTWIRVASKGMDRGCFRSSKVLWRCHPGLLGSASWLLGCGLVDRS